MKEILIAIIPAIVTLVTTILNRIDSNKNYSKMFILQMIGEDRLKEHLGIMPVNYQAVLHEFDIYTKNGGNSYVKEKVEEYKKWYKDLDNGGHNNG